MTLLIKTDMVHAFSEFTKCFLKYQIEALVSKEY